MFQSYVSNKLIRPPSYTHVNTYSPTTLQKQNSKTTRNYMIWSLVRNKTMCSSIGLQLQNSKAARSLSNFTLASSVEIPILRAVSLLCNCRLIELRVAFKLPNLFCNCKLMKLHVALLFAWQCKTICGSTILPLLTNRTTRSFTAVQREDCKTMCSFTD